MPEPWIRVHARLITKPVVARCAKALDLSRAEAAGYLVFFWSWMSEAHPDGTVVLVNDDEIEHAIGWTGRPHAFATFVKEKHTSRDGTIREWDEFMGPMIKTRERWRRNARAYRERLQALEDADADESALTSALTKPAPTASGASRAVTTERTSPTESPSHQEEVLDSDSQRTRRQPVVVRPSHDEDARAFARLTALPTRVQRALAMFLKRFYADADDVRLTRVLQQIARALSPEGVEFRRERIKANASSLHRAMEAVWKEGVSKDDAAIVVVLKKLQYGPANEPRNEKNETPEAAARRDARERVIPLGELDPQFVALVKNIAEFKALKEAVASALVPRSERK
jgi:hypothetical protein